MQQVHESRSLKPDNEDRYNGRKKEPQAFLYPNRLLNNKTHFSLSTVKVVKVGEVKVLAFFI